jgi:hypothetical protein
MKRFISSVSSKKEHLEAIGLITVNFAMLEREIQAGIEFLLGTDQLKAKIVTAELSFKNLLALFASLFRGLTATKEKISNLDVILKRLNIVEEKRNIIIHSLWAVGDSDATITRIKTTSKQKNGLKHQFEQVTVEMLNEIAEEIAQLAVEFQQFYFIELKFILPVKEFDEVEKVV